MKWLLYGFFSFRYELPHDKTNEMTVHPVKTQIRPVWSESSLGAQRVAKDPTFLHADREDWSDWSLRWGHSHFVGFVMKWLISQNYFIKVFSFYKIYRQKKTPKKSDTTTNCEKCWQHVKISFCFFYFTFDRMRTQNPCLVQKERSY